MLKFPQTEFVEVLFKLTVYCWSDQNDSREQRLSFLAKVDDLLKEIFRLMPFFIFILTHFSSRISFLQWCSTFQPRSSSLSQAQLNHLSLYSHCTICHLSPPASHFSLRDRDDFVWLWSAGPCDGCWVIPNAGLFQAVRCFFLQSNEKEGQRVMREGKRLMTEIVPGSAIWLLAVMKIELWLS